MSRPPNMQRKSSLRFIDVAPKITVVRYYFIRKNAANGCGVWQVLGVRGFPLMKPGRS